MRSAVRTSLALVLCAALSPSYTSAAPKVKLERAWANPGSENRKFTKLVVVGIAATPELRREYEQAFVDELQLRGVSATASSAMGSEAPLDRAALNERLRRDGVEALIVVRLLDPETLGANYSSVASAAGPPAIYHGGWQGYYANGLRNASSSAFAAHQGYRIETCMYDAQNDNLVWSGLSTLTVKRADAPGSEVKPHVGALVAGMERHKLVPALPKPDKKKSASK
jgi:hypothetical protein